MEVGEQPVHDAKSISGQDHETGLAPTHINGTVLASRTFEGPHHGGPHRPNAPTILTHSLHQRGQPRRYLVRLWVHRVLCWIFGLDWPECAWTDLQIQSSDHNPGCRQRVQHRRGEMQTGGYGGPAPLRFSVDGLVTRLIELG